MTFRSLKNKDQNQLLTLFKQLTEKTINFKIKNIINDKNCNCVVIEDNNDIIGFGAIIFFQIPTKGWTATIQDVVVDSKYRGKGLGKKLLYELLQIAKKNNIQIVNLTSSSKRIAARKLYQSFGFKLLDTGVFRLELGKIN